MNELLTTVQMDEADRLAVAMGVPGLTLMENAGRAVADEAEKMLPPGGRVVVLCGPGNNGGDGFVAARHLKERGYDVGVFLYGDFRKLNGDAGEMAQRWLSVGAIEAEFAAFHSQLGAADLIVDALFGAGLRGPLGDKLGKLLTGATGLAPILCVDVPSGLDGTTGNVVGDYCVQATRTVTFFRLKPAHVLYPGRRLCGDVKLVDIGIPEAVLGWGASEAKLPSGDVLKPDMVLNDAEVARRALSEPMPKIVHKYERGHAVVCSGPASATGAARLAARAALRIGAGVVTVVSPTLAIIENAAHLTAIMLRACDTADDLSGLLRDRRVTSVVIGPGFGVGARTREMVLAVLSFPSVGVVLDADALTSFCAPDDREQLFAAIGQREGESGVWQENVVMTPHEGEFKRLFPELEGSKIDRARAAAALSGASVVLKGADSVIAAPRATVEAGLGTIVVNANAPAWLATAGSGDVLAGLVAGLIAQGAAAHTAAAAAVWIHGECGNQFGPGLIAEDLPELVPNVMRGLYAKVAEIQPL